MSTEVEFLTKILVEVVTKAKETEELDGFNVMNALFGFTFHVSGFL